MRAGDPPYDFKELFAELRERPGLSALPGAARERASNALSDLILEGLHPDPAKRANADRLYRILRGPFEITSRATKSFLDDYFLLRFRQHLLPRASEIIDDQTRQPYHYQRLPNVRFTSFFDLPPARDRSRAQTARRKARDVEQRGDRAPRREESRGAARREQSRDAARRRGPRRPPRDPPGPPQSRPPPPR
jgi:hypothetical protein